MSRLRSDSSHGAFSKPRPLPPSSRATPPTFVGTELSHARAPTTGWRRFKGAAGDRIYFHGDDNERCPDDQACRLKTYVIANDEVIVSRTSGKFACSWFQPRKGTETVGWIETDRLAWQETTRRPAMPDWLGEWRAYDNVISISKAKAAGMLAIKGEATWGSGASTHTGELDYDAKPSADKMKFGDGTDERDCQVTMQRVGKHLVVGDNLHCGGANVSFSGVYQKNPKR